MASAMGIRTPRVDALTFGLGSGIAGLAGVALVVWHKIDVRAVSAGSLFAVAVALVGITVAGGTTLRARSVVLGSDCSREEWQAGINRAVELAPTNLHVLQTYRKPRRLEHPLFHAPAQPGLPATLSVRAGRLRLCPYYFVVQGEARLSGALATFCPPDKKIIHGMKDAILAPSAA